MGITCGIAYKVMAALTVFETIPVLSIKSKEIPNEITCRSVDSYCLPAMARW